MPKILNIAKSALKSVIIIGIFVGVIGFILLSLARNSGLSTGAPPDPLLTTMLNRSVVGGNLYLANNVIPPTNKWFSSLAFQQPSSPVFAWPLAMDTTTTGFDLSQPQIQPSASTITAPFTKDLTAQVSNQVEQAVSGYDDLSVGFTLTAQNVPQLNGRLTRGSPFLFLELQPKASISLTSGSFTLQNVGPHSAIYSLNGIRYGVYTDSSGLQQSGGQSLRLHAANSAVKLAIFAIPKDADSKAYFQAAAHPITKTTVQTKTSNHRLQTTYTLTTDGDQSTLLGLLPFTDAKPEATLGGFDTLEGHQTVHAGTSFSFNSPLTTPSSQLNMSKLHGSEKQQLMQLITTDTANLKFDKDDSYFAGKQLYRAAQLLQLAQQLGMSSQAASIQSQLKTQLDMWFDPSGYKTRSSKYFYYDNTIKGLVAVNSSFGSEQFNDHHFHYGYFLQAAAILARYDKSFLHDKQNFVNLLAKDVINTDRNDASFPYLRTFDAYVGHSWASGFGGFADGQNQESSSEAINAWAGAYLWGQVSGNSNLQSTALALYNRESQAALRLWLTKPPEADYQHAIVPLVWSGKLDYATFFSNTPEAKLGIQLIPMSPASTYLKPSKSSSLPAPLVSMNSELAGKEPIMFKDYILMYDALYDPSDARQKLASIKSSDLDDGDSMSYLYAWVNSQ